MRDDITCLNLREVLDLHTVDELVVVLKIINPEIKVKKKLELVNSIERSFANIDRLLAKCGIEEKNALAEATHNWDGRFLSDAFFAKYGRTVTFGSLSRYHQDDRPCGIMNVFLSENLIFS